MLLNLHVKNLALIEESEVTFGSGLNILSGETGAGKSIIIGSVNLALGGKVSKSMLRENAEFALVELIFSVEQEAQAEILRAMDIFPENGEIIMSRKIYASGRSVSRINSETVSASLMRKVASVLIDIHGQHEHESLLAKRNHMKYLDDFAKRALEEKKAALAAVYEEYTTCRKKLEEASLDAEQQAREISFLQYEMDEIDQAELKIGEDEELEADYRKLSNGRKIMEAIAECQELCAEGSKNASDQIGNAVHALRTIAQFDETLEGLAAQIEEIENLISDFNRELSGYVSELNFSEETFQQIEDRLNLINHLKAKYGKTIAHILEERQVKEEKLDQLQHYEEYCLQLQEKLKNAEERLAHLCQEVSDIRMEYAKSLAEQTKEALKDLNFLDVQFEMEFSRLDHYTANGWDETRFLISTNPGEPLKPLDAVASGGELSRIMLALKTVLAEHDEIETLIFDEIDSGISGRTAQMVAEKIKMTGKNHQIICITHLPQIAAMADHHFLIEKTSSADSTISNIRSLNREESIHELARMLGGVKITDTVLQNAKEMKEMADAVR
ncbi:DNA repair protein RecN [uncultured Eubacterium sp.]|uniref:DNA repair protein RecN n=1 Tax=uncultured Eubacterium sp. TaxID=165185 RepID=UPI0025EC3FF7|nr:DNA repair protein RecN [uncultured Eubacterium sp.]